MQTEELAKIIEHVKVLKLEPDDKLVLLLERRLTPDMRDHVAVSAKRIFGITQDIVILDGGVQIEVVRAQH